MKILVCGDTNGQFDTLISRVNTIIKKTGTYDLLFCVGEFFGDDKDMNTKLLNGHFVFPISTYVIGPSREHVLDHYPDADHSQLCNNVLYLGTKGFFTCQSSLSVAFVSGSESKDGKKLPHCFDMSDIASLQPPEGKDFEGVDILLTSQWPLGVNKYGSSFAEENKIDGSSLLSQLALLLKPRYHFSGFENVSYERQPYRNNDVLSKVTRHATRFVALANVGNADKKKFIYAFNITPMKLLNSSELTKQPTDATEPPYKSDPNIFIPREDKPQKEKSVQYFYDQGAIERGTVDNPRKRRRGGGDAHGAPKRQNISPESCWFCLANPKVEKHLVASVGEQCYLALAKGGLTEDHVLIVPINHNQSMVTSDADVLSDIELYKEGLTKYFNSRGKCIVFYERNFKTSHLQLQVIPLPTSCGKYLEQSITDFAMNHELELKELPQHCDLKQIIPVGAPYFYVEIPGRRRFYMNIRQGFPLNFGREMLCQPLLLNSPDMVDWKFCQLSREEEESCCAKFRDLFRSFDPFL